MPGGSAGAEAAVPCARDEAAKHEHKTIDAMNNRKAIVCTRFIIFSTYGFSARMVSMILIPARWPLSRSVAKLKSALSVPGRLLDYPVKNSRSNSHFSQKGR